MHGIHGMQVGMHGCTQASCGAQARYGTVKIGEQHGVLQHELQQPPPPPPPFIGQQPVQHMLPKHTGLKALYGLQQM
jgi:hypothetical protein